MTKSGPQKYPGASTVYWHQGRYGGTPMEVNVGCLHTTEGTTVPTYAGGASAPNFTALPDFRAKKLKWYQHFDFDMSSRALRNLSGGVQTNTLNVVQIELVGTCDLAHRIGWNGAKAGVNYLYWPDAPDWALKELAKFVRWAHDHHGVRMETSVHFKAYPSSYGNNGVRLSGSQWTRYLGWLGHQHVPEQDHGDPGDLEIAKVLAFAKGTADSEELDMDKKQVFDAIWDQDKAPAPDKSPTKATNPTWTPLNMVREIYNRLIEIGERLDAIEKKVDQ